jgi:hypothetical protein
VKRLHPTPFPRPRSALSARTAWALPAALAVALVWRVPSFFDPPWVNDEGTYFAIAQSMSHGFGLYTGLWENKPPAIYLLYLAVFDVAGPSLTAVRIVAALAVLGLVALVYVLADRYGGQGTRLPAAVLCGLLFGVPFLEGTTANAEVFLALLSALGAWLALVRGRPALAGIALGVAVLFKAVAGFDAAALGIWLYFNDRPMLRPYAVAWGSVLLALCAVCGLLGILPDMLREALLYDLGYVGQGNGGGVPVLLLLKLGVLALLTVVLRRRPYPYLWLAYAAAGALFSGRLFGHYVLQAIPPFCIVAAMLCGGRVRERTLLIAPPAIFLAGCVLSAAAGWSLAAAGHDSIFARRLQYYANFVRYAFQTESRRTYEGQVDDRVIRNVDIANDLRRQPAGRLLVWGNSPWIYPLSGRLPATRYTSALRQPAVPNETPDLRRAVGSGAARELVVILPPAPPLGSASRSLPVQYRRTLRVGNAEIYVSTRAPARLASARTTARTRNGIR